MNEVSLKASQPPTMQYVAPNLYQLEGGGIDVSYLPSSAGGRSHLMYQDPYGTLRFSGDQIRSVEVPDLGTVVTVTLVLSVDDGSTTFSVLLPHVKLLNQLGTYVPTRTKAITTVHKSSLFPAFNQGQRETYAGQRETYAVTRLHGTASTTDIPL